MPAQYVLRKSTNDQYYFSLTAENNQKILASELYVAKNGAMNGIQSVKQYLRQIKKKILSGLHPILSSPNPQQLPPRRQLLINHQSAYVYR